nr:hypothetical protein [Cytophagales bacterium]
MSNKNIECPLYPIDEFLIFEPKTHDASRTKGDIDAIAGKGRCVYTGVSGKFTIKMSLNDKIRYNWIAEVSKGKSEIVHDIEKKIENYKWTDFLSTQIDFKEFNINDGEIEILSKPGAFTAFRPWGKISIKLNEQVSGTTTLTCDILPMNGNFPFIVYLTIGALTLWTIGSLFTTFTLTIVLTILGFWGLFGLCIYFQYRYYRSTLIGYSKRVVDFIQSGK